MAVFALDEHLIFPHPVLREEDGLLAVGGDLTAARLILAYRWGIFPWYSDGQPLLWWWTAPRLVLKPEEVHISHSLEAVLRKNEFTVTYDTVFEQVISRCSAIQRTGQAGTWITEDMKTAYIDLHDLGYAHSVEVWHDNTLVGGLYGVVYGGIFSGESMFAEMPNASKVGFVTLARQLQSKHFDLIDCQQDTKHLRSMGGYLIEEVDYLARLRKNHERVSREGDRIF